MFNQEEYDKVNTTKITLKLNNNTDKDILDLIDKTMKKDSVSKQGAVKKLIRGRKAKRETTKTIAKNNEKGTKIKLNKIFK